MDVVSDRELLDAAVDGDNGAFGDLFQRHASAVYNHCFRQLASWSDAEDATSVVFLETWRRRSDARDVDGSLLPWLLVVATNVTRNHHRSTRRYRTALSRLPPERVAPDHAEQVTDRLAAEHQMAHVRSLVDRLGQHEQDVIALCVWAELSYTDAAHALDVTAATVRTRLARARTHLRQLHRSTPTPATATTRSTT